MSLKIWLPLDSDLRNLGCSNVIVTNNGATVNANGKIGRCYEFGTNKYIKLIDYAADFLTYNEFSLSVWFKCTAQNTAHSGSALISGGNWNQANNLLQFSLGDFSTDHYTKLLISGSGNWAMGYSYNFYLNTWYHVVLTSGNGKMRAYVNGQLIGDTYNAFKPASLEQTWICIGNGTYAQLFHFIGLMNDVRIYDHCLSAAEVHEIAQGLVLHYKLDSFQGGYGNPNLLPASDTTHFDTTRSFEFQGWVNNFYTTAWVNEHLTEGQQYTLSYTVTCISIPDTSIYSVSETRASPILVHQGGGWSQITTTNDGIKSTNLLPGQSRTYKCTFTFATTTESQAYYGFCGYTCLYRNADRTSSEYAKFRIDNLKLELGSDVTPWVPNINDENVDVTHIQDSSGYNHNGTIVGSVTLAADTARYGISTHIDGAGVITTTTPGADIRTLSCWVKTTKNKSTSQMLVADSASNMCISFYQGAIIGVFGPTRSTGSKSILGTSYKENNWNHIVVVKTSDDGKRDIYCNGEKLTPVADDYWNVTGGFFIGQRNGTLSGNTPFFGYISDVRAYCTPLLDTDIKQLYNIGMKVDNLGGVHGFEFDEKAVGTPLNKIYYPTNQGVSYAYDEATDTYTLTCGDRGSSSNQALYWPEYNRSKTNYDIEIGWGQRYIHTAEFYSSKAITVYIDYNDNAINTDELSGNDNDTKRLAYSVTLPANVWTRIVFGYSNLNETKNPNHLILYDYSYIYTASHTDTFTVKIRNIHTYVINADSNHLQIAQKAISHNQFIEDGTHDYASISNKSNALHATEFIEI